MTTLLFLAALVLAAPAHEAEAPVTEHFEAGRWGLTDAEGNVVLPAAYELVERIGSDRNDGSRRLILAGPDDAWIVDLDRQGHATLERYDQIRRTNTGTYVHRDGKVGMMIAHLGRMTVPIEYDHIQETHIPPRVVVKGGRHGLMNDGGTLVLPAEYDRIEEGYDWPRRVEQAGAVGLVDDRGRFVVPVRYEDVQPSATPEDGLYRVREEGRWGVVDGAGRTRVPLRYEALDGMYAGVARVVEDGVPGFVHVQAGAMDPFTHRDRRHVTATAMQEAGGWTSAPEPLDPRLPPGDPGLRLVPLPDAVPWHVGVRGDVREHMTVYVANDRDQDLVLEGRDGSLVLVQQARAPDGTWQAIEAWREPWCGNSRYGVTLPAGHQRLVAVPRYQGAYRTELRVVLRDGDRRVTSEPWPGSVDPAQFEHLPDDGTRPGGLTFLE